MVQLAFVLLLKYCDAWRESKDNKRLKTSLSSKPICQIAPISCNNIKKGRQAPKVNRDLTERKNHGIYENPGHLAGAAVYSERRFCYVIPISPQLLSCKLYLLGSYCLKWYVYF